jgi:pyochelin biosynthetic protein PchC
MSAQYRPWRNRLPTDVAISAADLPGRGSLADEKPTTGMGELIFRLTDELELDPQVPVVIFGHSLGAAIGYELAQSLGDAIPVAGLIASGRCRHSPKPTWAPFSMPKRALTSVSAEISS